MTFITQRKVVCTRANTTDPVINIVYIHKTFNYTNLFRASHTDAKV